MEQDIFVIQPKNEEDLAGARNEYESTCIPRLLMVFSEALLKAEETAGAPFHLTYAGTSQEFGTALSSGAFRGKRLLFLISLLSSVSAVLP